MPEITNGGGQYQEGSFSGKRERSNYVPPADLSGLSLKPETKTEISAQSERSFHENREHLLNILSEFDVLRGYQVKEILALAKALSKAVIEIPCPDSVFAVMARDENDPNIGKFKALNEGVGGFKTGPQIDAVSTSAACPGISFHQLISAIKAFNIDAVGVVAPDGRAERRYVWILYFRDERRDKAV